MLKKNIIILLLIGNYAAAVTIYPTIEDAVKSSSNTQNTSQQNPCNYNNKCEAGETIINCHNDCTSQTVRQSGQQTERSEVETKIIQKESGNILTKSFLLSMIFVIIFLSLLFVLAFCLHNTKRRKYKNKEKTTQIQSQFGLPQRPQRKWGL